MLSISELVSLFTIHASLKCAERLIMVVWLFDFHVSGTCWHSFCLPQNVARGVLGSESSPGGWQWEQGVQRGFDLTGVLLHTVSQLCKILKQISLC